jgi:hypothetical protein
VKKTHTAERDREGGKERRIVFFRTGMIWEERDRRKRHK